MFVHRSNRSERLIDALSDVVREPLDALAPELIVVHSKGMERFVSMQLGERLGVFANAEFPFPRHLIERIFDAVLGDDQHASAAFEERTAMWSIAALLPSLRHGPGFEPIAHYLADDPDGRQLLQLARRIARVFDDYAVYRPELLLEWEQGAEHGWEALLWRALCDRYGRGHQPARAQRCLNALSQGRFDASALPARLCLFGVSCLPPLYVSVLSALAQFVPTHLFVLSPSREYFADLSARRPRGAADDDAEEARRNPLLATLGKLGREFQALLEERSQYVELQGDLYEDPGTDTLLHALQSDMLHLRTRGDGGEQTPRIVLGDGDASIRIAVCHSRVRELEALHDELVAILEDPSIEPHDIVVMTPDIEAYAPAIDAVFGENRGRPPLPYCVADRKTRATHPVALALSMLVDALRGRLTASRVLDLLSLDCIRRRFAIEAEDLARLRDFIDESGIRWGVDAEHRREVGQPALSDNTFRHGLARMLLGYAMPADGGRIFAGVLPSEVAEGSEAALLGKLAEACERLFAHRAAFAQPRSLPEWRLAFLALMGDMIDAGPARAQEHQIIRAALDRVADAGHAAGFEGLVELREMQSELDRALEERAKVRGLLSMGITFCQLVPMRGIPFKVVCLIGMNDDAFPRRNPRIGFDRMADPSTRRLGDRNLRDDDRYLFLEAILCARERLLISYVGRGVRDNRVLAPSVLVGELLDAIERCCALPGGSREALEARLTVEHRLHAFSPRYFEQGSDSGLFSYSALACEAAHAIGRVRSDPRWLDGPLEGVGALAALSIEDLIAWVSAPVRTFLQRRLGLYLEDDLAIVPAREPLGLSGLDHWQVGTDLLALALEGHTQGALLSVARGSGRLPLGAVGADAVERLLPDVAALAGAALQYRQRGALAPLAVELDVAGVRLVGTLHGLFPDAHLLTTFSKLGRRFELAHFVRHVVLGCVLRRERDRFGAYPSASVIVARDPDTRSVAELRYDELDDPERVLCELLELVKTAQSRALPFLHDVSRCYVEELAHKGREAARNRAEKAFRSQQESEDRTPDRYVAKAFPDFEMFAQESDGLWFGEVAERVFSAMLRARRVTTVKRGAA